MLEARLGRLLRNVHAGDRHLLRQKIPAFEALPALNLTSTAFADGTAIPQRHAGKRLGPNLSPPLAWSGVPPAAQALVLIVEDPDAPVPRPIMHLLAELPSSVDRVVEGALNAGSAVARLGRDLRGRTGYSGPGPVLEHGPHRYVFQLLALSKPLPSETPQLTYKTLLRAVRGDDGQDNRVLAFGQLQGTYTRSLAS